MTSAENSVSEPPNLRIFWRRIPPDPPTKFVLSTLAILKKKRKEKTRYGPVITRDSNQGTRLKLSFVFIYTILTLIE